jgi:hypothetical protein
MFFIIKNVSNERIHKFIYRGSLSAEYNEISDEMKERLENRNRSYFSLPPILQSWSVWRKTVEMYKTVIKHSATCGTVTKKEEETLSAGLT